MHALPTDPPSGATRSRKLRMALAIAFAFVCAVFVVLWWRSYSYHDNYIYRFEVKGVSAASHKGALLIGVLAFWTGLPFDESDGNLRIRHWIIREQDWMVPIRERYASFLGFSLIQESFADTLVIPYWFLCSSTALGAGLLWPNKSQQFQLRTLLVAMTVVAVVFGIAVYAARR